MKVSFRKSILTCLAGRGRRSLALIISLIFAGQVFGWLLASMIGPAPTRLSADAQGDESLRTAVLQALDGDTLGLDAMAVVKMNGETVRFATFGQQLDGAPVDASTSFEIGSVTKALTGLLLADLIDAGRVEAHMRLADATQGVVPMKGEYANATLSRLARHRAGWPSLPVAMLLRSVLLPIGGRNPYVGEPERVFRMAAAQDASRGEQSYSNLGFATLGNALAARERTDFASLLERRVLAPLQMRDTYVLGTDDALPERRVQGRDSAGRAIEAWRASGWQPAGIGIWSTASDLSRLAGAVLAGTAPGQQATVPPPGDRGNFRLGYGWMVRYRDDHKVLWHNGGTGGFRTWFGLLEADGRGVAVLSNTVRSVDALGEHLLLKDNSPDERGVSPISEPLRWTDVALVIFIVLGTVLPLAQTVRHLRRRNADRQMLIRGIAGALSVLALTRALVAWESVPVAIWNLGAGFTMACVLGAIFAWPTTSVVQGSDPVRRRLTTLLLCAWYGALIAFAV